MGHFIPPTRDAISTSGHRRRRIDHLLHFSDFCRRKAADLSLLPDNSLIVCEIDAEGFVISYVARPTGYQDRAGAALHSTWRQRPEVAPAQKCLLWDRPLNDEPARCHNVLLRLPLHVVLKATIHFRRVQFGKAVSSHSFRGC
jgi:hypothetical protein